jgi:hypothetical protein
VQTKARIRRNELKTVNHCGADLACFAVKLTGAFCWTDAFALRPPIFGIKPMIAELIQFNSSIMLMLYRKAVTLRVVPHVPER